MEGMMEFFEAHIKDTICPRARERLESEIIPKLCVDCDICPACGGDLRLETDMRSAYMWSLKICVKCSKEYENSAVKRRTYGQR